MMRLKKNLTYKQSIEGLTGGIFHYLGEQPWNEVVTPLDSDLAFTFNKSKQLINNSVQEMINDLGADKAYRTIAIIINTMFKSKWENMYKVFTADYPVTQSYGETIKELTTEDRIKDNTLTHDNMVSAYDSDELSQQDRNISKDDGTEKVENTRDYERIGTNVKNIENNIIRLQNYLFYGIIFTDIASVLLNKIKN